MNIFYTYEWCQECWRFHLVITRAENSKEADDKIDSGNCTTFLIPRVQYVPGSRFSYN
jgi:hypothetical protein